ncbi:hypothetical protein BDZ97DRAFT_2062420 [Flammula alnicola]|nr:hypothetical protein BDZ97DRAFT_2062420 [Flammula alnicola]
MCRLGLGLKAPALARLWAAQALCKSKTDFKLLLDQTFVNIQYKKKPRPGPRARAYQIIRPGQSRLQANTFGPAWPGFFGPGLARLLASGRSRHITNVYRVFYLGMPRKLKTLIISPNEKWMRWPIAPDFMDNNMKTISATHSLPNRMYLAIDNPEDALTYKTWINGVARPDLVDVSEARSDFA